MATTHVIYDGNRIIPAPFINLSKSYQTTDDGTKIGSLFDINVIGTIVAFKGSPTSSGTFWTAGDYPPDETKTLDEKLASIIRKQESLRELFADEGKTFEVQSADGSQPMKFNPVNIKIDFQDDLWVDRCAYTISMQADTVSVDGVALGEDTFSEYIQTATEEWSFETNEDQPESVDFPTTYRLTHSLSAQGKRHYDDTGALEKPAWEQARAWVEPRLGFDSTIALSSGVNNLPDFYQGLNHTRNENIGENTGSYSVTETWILASGTALEDFTVTTQEAQDTGLTTVSIEGNIKGLDQRDANMNILTGRYDNAASKFVFASGQALTRAQLYSGKTLNVNPLTSTISRVPGLGNITYSYEYNNRPSNLIEAAKVESIQMNNTFGVQSMASVFVLGRNAGPVLQDLSTYQEATRSLSIDLIFGDDYDVGSTATEMFIDKHPRNTSNTPISTQLAALVNAIKPVESLSLNNIGAVAKQQFITEQSDNWDPIAKQYTYNITWTFE